MKYCKREGCNNTVTRDHHSNYPRYCSDSCKKPAKICQANGCNELVGRSKNGQARLYCTPKCATVMKTIKRRATNLRLYGVEHPSQRKDIQEKTKLTNLEKYGVENPFQSSEVKEKIKFSNIEKYKVPYATQSSVIKKKTKLTNLEKYGVEYSTQADSVKEKIKTTNLKRHGHECPLSSDVVREKVKKTILEKYGCEYITQNAKIRDKVKQTNLRKFGVESFQQKTFSEETRSVLNDSKKLQELFLNNSIPTMADKLSVGHSTIYKYLTLHGIRRADGPSSFELGMREMIASLGCKYLTGNRSIISPLELDIYLPYHNLAIECNGSYWHSELNGKDRHYHLNKTKLCEEKGIQLIHIWEHDWIKNPELIKCRLLSKLGKNERVFARKTQVAKLTTQTSAEFLNQHHIQGTCPASVKYGLYEGEELSAVMTLGKSRFSKKYEWELLRYCSAKQVVGGASKLFSHFKKEHQPKSVVSYSDKMWNTGNLYQSLGFDYSHASDSSYYYTKNYVDFFNRVQFQKHKLHKKLEHFDPNLTEWENMQANGFDRIWDCGSDVWMFTNSYHYT